MTCTICKSALQLLKKIKGDFLITFAEIKAKRHDKHFYFSFLIMTVMLFSGVILYPNTDNGLLIFISTFGALIINTAREWYYENKSKEYYNGVTWVRETPCDYRDVRYGMYGGLIAGLLVVAVRLLLN